jgi:small subunit ribosomal protein S14
MPKQSAISREAKREKLVKKYYAKRMELREKNDSEGLAKLPRNSMPTRRRNRCAVTGHSRGYIRKFGLNRITFRELASEGAIPGITKASL